MQHDDVEIGWGLLDQWVRCWTWDECWEGWGRGCGYGEAAKAWDVERMGEKEPFNPNSLTVH